MNPFVGFFGRLYTLQRLISALRLDEHARNRNLRNNKIWTRGNKDLVFSQKSEIPEKNLASNVFFYRENSNSYNNNIAFASPLMIIVTSFLQLFDF